MWTRILDVDVNFPGQAKTMSRTRIQKLVLSFIEILNKGCRTFFTPFGENPTFPPIICLYQKRYRYTKPFIRKLLKCDVKNRIRKGQSVVDKMLT